MKMEVNLSDTIAAISTPVGVGGLSVIRVSGAEAIRIVKKVLPTWRVVVPDDKPRYPIARFVRVLDLDDVVVTLFCAPHSFTGEDTVEISCHGSWFIQHELMRRLTDAGCRLARAGEFTQRAFLNGKMDLSQAEAVADLIASHSEAEKNLALRQMRGGLSSQLSRLREQLVHFASLLELELDFADHEDLEFVDRSELLSLASTIDKHIEQLLSSFAAGNAIKNGVAVAIVGEPNAGKSTLLNALLGEERAIVSAIEGTTRDTVEDSLYLSDIHFRLIDTAGIRNTDDPLEKMGVERSERAVMNAHIVVEVVDATRPRCLSLSLRNEQRYIRVLNKSDLLSAEQVAALSVRQTTGSESKPLSQVLVSAKQGEIDALRDELVDIGQRMTASSDVALSNVRHYEVLQRASQALERVKSGLHEGLSGEFVSLDLQDCLTCLGEVTGEITSQEVLQSIFSKFCIGK
ncbi:MAG: tRNA uridine-5-carboxymethylaminomethyl(34) synthesis GTPase MnmE [Paludibacteraceae bacterium]|nr:tRNA uridine-5-carboxymethylaminomethyl(34) synthesis GTPase MnmE [Paludibacteraceae bacterium]